MTIVKSVSITELTCKISVGASELCVRVKLTMNLTYVTYVVYRWSSIKPSWLTSDHSTKLMLLCLYASRVGSLSLLECILELAGYLEQTLRTQWTASWFFNKSILWMLLMLYGIQFHSLWPMTAIERSYALCSPMKCWWALFANWNLGLICQGEDGRQYSSSLEM